MNINLINLENALYLRKLLIILIDSRDIRFLLIFEVVVVVVVV